VTDSETPLEDHLRQQVERSRAFFWNRARWELVQSVLSDSASAVVDVGAGTGFLGDYLAEERPEVDYEFVEPIAPLEQRLVKRFGRDHNRRGLDFAGASHVCLLDVLEHQADDRAFLCDLAARMDPGATLIMTVPAMPSLWSGWDRKLGHFRRYTRPMLADRVEEVDLELRESAYLFPELVPAGWWRRRGDPGDDPRGDAEFPDLPAPINALLYRIATATTRTRRFWPVGTSLFAVLGRPSETVGSDPRL
jgi:SAM-dependent methyltransferase